MTTAPTSARTHFQPTPFADGGPIWCFAHSRHVRVARAEIKQLRAVADAARDIVREGGRADYPSILEQRLRALD
jgi:hypothetical protein